MKQKTFVFLILIAFSISLIPTDLRMNQTQETVPKSSYSDNFDVDYLIITSNSLKSSLEPLSLWKSQKGSKSHIVTIEEINKTFNGDNIHEKNKQ